MKSPIRWGWCALLCGLCATGAHGWWSSGHQNITDGAIQHLPEPLATFFRANEFYIVIQSGVEPPGTHYIDIDAYPEFDPADPYSVSRDLDALIALHGAPTVYGYGTAPWTVEAYVETLTVQMAEAGTANDWLVLRTTAAELAHYIGDLHNPLHLTENYNGQLTGNDGIHARYEGVMISRNLSGLSVAPAPVQCVYLPSPIDAIFDGIYAHHPFVSDIIAADTLNRGDPPTYSSAYYAAMWSDTGAFTGDLFQEASETLASAWYTAWVDAGFPNPVFSPGMGDADADGDVDLADYAAMQTCIGVGYGLPVPPECERLDFDGDVTVTASDLPAFLTVLNGP